MVLLEVLNSSCELMARESRSCGQGFVVAADHVVTSKPQHHSRSTLHHLHHRLVSRQVTARCASNTWILTDKRISFS